MDCRQMEFSVLLSACALDNEDIVLWTEFLTRYGVRIKRFINKASALWKARPYSPYCAVFGGEDQNDLFQAVMVRLVENECALIRRFSGASEDDWLAYVASISYSVVCDAARRQLRSKRRAWTSNSPDFLYHEDLERKILAMEMMDLCMRMMGVQYRQHSARDRLIFMLYFVNDLSLSQIAKCVGLSKPGVQNVVDRLIDCVRRVVEEDGSQLKVASIGKRYGRLHQLV